MHGLCEPQSRAFTSVGASTSYWPCEQSPTGWQASVLLDTDEYVESGVHGAHVTSDVALPATDTPWPAGHSDHGEQVAYDADDAIHAPLPW